MSVAARLRASPGTLQRPAPSQPVVAVLGGIVVGLVMAVVAQQDTRWLVYAVLGCGAATTILVAGLRRVLVPSLVVGLSLNVHYYLTTPEPLRFIGSSGPTYFSIPLVLLPALGLAILTALDVRAGVARFRWGLPVSRFAVMMIATAILSTLLSRARRYGIFYVAEMLQYFLLFLVAVNIIRTKADLDRVIRLLLVTLGIQGTVFMLQTVTGTTFTLNGHLAEGAASGELVRACGTVGTTPWGYATFVEPLMFTALAFWRIRNSEASPAWTGALAILGIVTVVLTGNRTSWVTLVLGVTMVEVLCRRRGIARRLSGTVVVSAFVLLVGIAAAVIPMVLGRLEASHSDDWLTRKRLMQIAINMIAGNPIVGVGPGGYPFHVKSYLVPGVKWLWVVHNEFLLTWAERGIIGFVAYLAWMRSGLLEAIRATRAPSRTFQALGIGCTTGIVGLWWEYMLNMYGPYSCYALLWFLFGVLVAGNTIYREAEAT